MPVPTLLEDVDTSKLRRHCERRRAQLKEKRQPWLDFCRYVAEELLPNRMPYLLDPKSGQRSGEQNTHIVDAVGHLSLSTAAAGIHTGLMPTTSTWLNLIIRGLFSDEVEERGYLEDGARILLTLHNQSNANNVLPECQKEWLAFGTAAALIFEDDEDDWRLDGLSVGEYCIADDNRGRVDTLYRELTMTVGQLADEFGLERLSAASKTAYERGDYDNVVACVHAIEPDRDGKNPHGHSEDMPWRSVYYEETSDTKQVLAVRGFSKFPALVWRAGKLPGSAYGYGRGHDVLPHLVRLRRLIYRYGEALAYKAQPPVQVPAGTQQHEVRYMPGGKTPVFGLQPITPLFRVELELQEVSEEMEKCKQMIRDTLGATLVASLRQITQQMTAREADLRTSQDLTEFLPELNKQTEELLNPYVEWMFEIATQRGRMPQEPQSIRGRVIDIEFTSPLARKQRQGEVDAIVRTFAIAAEFAKVPGMEHVVDHLDVAAAIRKIAEILGAPVGVLVPLEQVRKLQAARAQQQLAQAQAGAAQQSADIAKTAGEAHRLAAVA